MPRKRNSSGSRLAAIRFEVELRDNDLWGMATPRSRVDLEIPAGRDLEMDVVERLGLDVLPVEPPVQFFGLRREAWKPWRLWDGTEVLVPGQFEVEVSPDGDWLLHAEGDPCRPIVYQVDCIRDGGSFTTRVTFEPQAVLFTLGEEAVRFSFDTWLDHCLDLPHGFENRRGLCGLLRVDFRDPLETVNYQVSIVH